jgi:MmyB-like transcription regulator ligand binding domain
VGIALTGDASRREGAERSVGYRWFTDPAARAPYPADEQTVLTRVYASGLRELITLRGPDSRAAQLAKDLLAQSEEFRDVWAAHEVGLRPPDLKRFNHSEVGALELSCQTLLDPDQSHRLLVYTASPGSDSHDKLQLLAVIGAQTLA